MEATLDRPTFSPEEHKRSLLDVEGRIKALSEIEDDFYTNLRLHLRGKSLAEKAEHFDICKLDYQDSSEYDRFHSETVLAIFGIPQMISAERERNQLKPLLDEGFRSRNIDQMPIGEEKTASERLDDLNAASARWQREMTNSILLAEDPKTLRAFWSLYEKIFREFSDEDMGRGLRSGILLPIGIAKSFEKIGEPANEQSVRAATPMDDCKYAVDLYAHPAIGLPENSWLAIQVKSRRPKSGEIVPDSQFIVLHPNNRLPGSQPPSALDNEQNRWFSKLGRLENTQFENNQRFVGAWIQASVDLVDPLSGEPSSFFSNWIESNVQALKNNINPGNRN